MSDPAVTGRLQQSTSQFPVDFYFDETRYAIEIERLFNAGPGYRGHEQMVPEHNDYRTLEWQDHARMLMRAPDGVYDLSNVCRHRQAIMLTGSGNARAIVCPIHRWTYDTEGRLLGAPHFPRNPCLQLDRRKLESWHGLLFAGPRSAVADLAGMKLASELDFTGYRLNRVELHQCNYNWKTFVEVYLEDYHVVPFHPGLGKFVTCDDLTWELGERYSVQRVGLGDLARAGSPSYARWQKELVAYYGKDRPRHGAVWLTYYPNVMVEWYPHTLIVSTLHPQAVDRTLNVIEFYYPEDIALFEEEFVKAEQAAYLETASEDDEIAERMDRGRRALLREGSRQVGPYQSPMEDGMQHFHEFYRRVMA